MVILSERIDKTPQLKEHLYGAFYVIEMDIDYSQTVLLVEKNLYETFQKLDNHEKGKLLAVLQVKNEIEIIEESYRYLETNRKKK